MNYKKDNEKLLKLVQARVQPEHFEIVQALADAEGLSMSGWLRRMIIKECNFATKGIDGWVPKDIPDRRAVN